MLWDIQPDHKRILPHANGHPGVLPKLLPCLFLFALFFAHIFSFSGYAASASSNAPARVERATRPVVTSTMKQNGVPISITQGQAGSVAGKKTAASTASAKAQKKPAQTAGLEGFSSNPFGTNNKNLPSLYGGPRQKNNSDAVTWKKTVPRNPAGSDIPVSFSGKAKSAPESRLAPQQQAPFMGGEHTLPYMDAEKTAELSLEYKLSPKTTTRFVVNPQDTNSPLHRPAEQEKLLNSGGLYMDVEVSDNMQLKLGGEYCEIDDSSQHTSSRSSQGVAVGVQWNF